ncbi:MAG: 4'-phosphopantetheinyl transferase superfamily protein [Actinomycetota bacterium]|nr:4'-phosphopantetheinyl transferase superfamily protein [Actinomycetota bacterium]
MCTPAELRRLRAAGDLPEWATVSFAAKEAAYKALNPLTGLWIGFEEAEVGVNLARRDLVVRIVSDRLAGVAVRGQHELRRHVVVVAIALDPAHARRVTGLAAPDAPQAP